VLGGRPAQEAALGTIARTLTSGVCDVDTLPWERLRHQGPDRNWPENVA
jgi:hypothetical protein